VVTFKITILATYAAAYIIAPRDTFHLFFGQHVFNTAQFKIWFFHNRYLINGFASFFGFGFPYPVLSRQATCLLAKQYFSANSISN